jgi:LuxR family maltose regulon positive regulatory protein
MSFPRTKIQPPRARSVLVERGDLRARLADALTSRALVLLCAPAGYGKTTLLAAEVARWPEPFALAWVSADAGDDLQRLLECMLAALEPYDPPWRTAPEALLATVGRGQGDACREVAAEIINTLDACAVPRGLIVFDDVHRVEDPAFFRFLDQLIERRSPRWTLALTSRTEPPLALARLRAADDLVEFRQGQLQFARADAHALAAQSGLGVAAADRLFDRTHGWPAGLRIGIGAVLAATGGDESATGQGSDHAPLPQQTERALRAVERPMFDYLVAEVLEQLPAELADFLLCAAVLPELDPARCAEVTGHGESDRRLDDLERLGLFVDVLDSPTRTLRLHDLFRDALQQQLRLRQPERFAELRQRVAETEPDWKRRVTLLLELGEAGRAAAVMFTHAPALTATTGHASTEHLIGQFPAAFRERSPELAFLRGLTSWTNWDFPGMHASLERAAAGFAATGDTGRTQLAQAFLAHALLTLGRIDAATALIGSLRSQSLPEPARVMLLNAEIWLAIETCRHAAVAPLLAEMLGRLQSLPQHLELWFHTTPPLRMPGLPGITPVLARHAELLQQVGGDSATPLRALSLLSRAWCVLWQGRIADARSLVAEARADARWSGQSGAVRAHLASLDAAIATAIGDAEGALAAANARIGVYAAGATSWHRHMVGVFVARIASANEQLSDLRSAWDRLATTRSLPELSAISQANAPVETPIAANLAWLEGREDDAIGLWRQALDRDEVIDLIGQAAETRVRLARALVRRGELTAAAAALRPVFDRSDADADGGPGGALFAPAALQELAEARWGDALPPRRVAQLRRWRALPVAEHTALRPPLGPAAPSPDVPSTREVAGPFESFTPRELEVLAHIAGGDSNKHIARALDLSLHTVKRHVANILGKLDASTRGQAAAWYRTHVH